MTTAIQRYTLLHVEDDANDAWLVRRAFEKSQLRAHYQVVADGENAIAYLAGLDPYSDRNRYPLPNFILLDLKLPGKSGFEVLEWLRRQNQIRFLPVVILSSSGEETDIARAYTLGANSYLVKPSDFDGLSSLVRLIGQYWLQANRNPPREIEVWNDTQIQ